MKKYVNVVKKNNLQVLCHIYLNVCKRFLPDDKILPLSKLKAIPDDLLNVIQNIKFGFYGVENIVGRGEMLVTSIFSFSRHVFKRHFPQDAKSRHCAVKR